MQIAAVDIRDGAWIYRALVPEFPSVKPVRSCMGWNGFNLCRETCSGKACLFWPEGMLERRPSLLNMVVPLETKPHEILLDMTP